MTNEWRIRSECVLDLKCADEEAGREEWFTTRHAYDKRPIHERAGGIDMEPDHGLIVLDAHRQRVCAACWYAMRHGTMQRERVFPNRVRALRDHAVTWAAFALSRSRTSNGIAFR